jgi:hypothetical protein
MRLLPSVFLALLICGLGWFQFGQPLSAKALLARAEDNFDSRPARAILILGNSRTSFNDMPDMIRAMADSAHDPQKLEITLDAPNYGDSLLKEPVAASSSTSDCRVFFPADLSAFFERGDHCCAARDVECDDRFSIHDELDPRG